jgi:phosphate transport system substrate-binding protein
MIGRIVGLAGRLGLTLVLGGGATPAISEVVEVDSGIPSHRPVAGVAGNLSSIGSDTLNNLMTIWAEGFRSRYPGVRVQVEGKGSSTAPPALISATAQLGPMSREMKPSEIDPFEARFGYPPTQVRVAIDALAVYAHKDNPLTELTLPELDAIFSRTRACGGAESLARWSQLGLGDAYAGRAISLYGRNSASGTYGYFKEIALCRGDFRDTVKEQPGSASVVNGVGNDRFGIGYSGIGYRTSAVKALALAGGTGADYRTPSPGEAYAGRYPLARFLYVYVNEPPNSPLDVLAREFLRFVISREGQEAVVRDGYLPLTLRLTEQEAAKLD